MGLDNYTRACRIHNLQLDIEENKKAFEKLNDEKRAEFGSVYLDNIKQKEQEIKDLREYQQKQ